MATDVRNRDPLAITIAVVGLAVQVGAWFWWGGQMTERMRGLESRIVTVETKSNDQVRSDAQQDQQLAVSVSQYAEVIRRLDSIDKKLETR